jgi:hypothetical protein
MKDDERPPQCPLCPPGYLISQTHQHQRPLDYKDPRSPVVTFFVNAPTCTWCGEAFYGREEAVALDAAFAQAAAARR